MKLDWGIWLYGLMNGVIGGAATSAAAYLGMSGAAAAGANVPKLNWEALGVILVSGAATNLFFFLKQSPLPTIETSVTTTKQTTTEKVTVTVPTDPNP